MPVLVRLGSHRYHVPWTQEVFIVRGPKPPPIELTARQRAVLQRLARRHSAPHHLVSRARLILLAADGQNNSQIGQQLALVRAQVRRWRTRWLDAAARLAAAEAADTSDDLLTRTVEALLADAPRPGTPPKFTPEQIVQLVALACEPPADSERPISHWTPRELADEAIQRGIVETISARSVGRFLK
jgi:putative transposase